MRHTLHLEATHLGTVKATRGGHTATALKAKGRIRADMGTPAVRTWPAAPGRRGRRGRSSCQSPAMRQLRHGPGHLQIHLGSVSDTAGRKSKAKTSAPEKEEALLCLAVHPAPGWHLAGRGWGTRCPTRAGEGGAVPWGTSPPSLQRPQRLPWGTGQRHHAAHREPLRLAPRTGRRAARRHHGPRTGPALSQVSSACHSGPPGCSVPVRRDPGRGVCHTPHGTTGSHSWVPAEETPPPLANPPRCASRTSPQFPPHGAVCPDRLASSHKVLSPPVDDGDQGAGALSPHSLLA